MRDKSGCPGDSFSSCLLVVRLDQARLRRGSQTIPQGPQSADFLMFLSLQIL